MSDYTYSVCNSCAVVIDNGDTSHLDDESAQHIENELEGTGPLTRTGDVEGDGDYLRCDVCGIDTLDGTAPYETL